MNAPTMLVIEMLQMKAMSGLVKPGVLKNFLTDSKNGGSSSPLSNFSISELEKNYTRIIYRVS